jgi:hypothetical protein
MKHARIPRIDARPVKIHLGWGNGVGATPGYKRRQCNHVSIPAGLGGMWIGVDWILGANDVSILEQHGLRHVLLEAAKLFP